MGRFDNPEQILLGPKWPHWSCNACAWGKNWASRTCCQKCGKEASSKQVGKARAAHAKAEAEGQRRWAGGATNAQGGRKKGWGEPANHWKGPEAQQLEALQEIARLKEQVASLQTAGGKTGDADMVVEKEAAPEEPPKENIAEMHQEYEDFKRTKGESHPLTVVAKKLADEARTRRDGAKSLDQLGKRSQQAKAAS